MENFNFHKANKANKGFTLIELLVVIAIIGVLSTLAVVALGNARTKARDSRRVADVKQMSMALELYYADNNRYPEMITPGESIVSPDGSRVYLQKVPSNPTPRTDGTCGDNEYTYTPGDNRSSYTLRACIASVVNNLAPGNIVYTPGGFAAGADSSHAQ